MRTALRNERLYLIDAREAIDKALTYAAGGREVFFAETIVQDAVIRNLEIIGEAVKNLTPATRARHPDVPWAEIAGMRDRRDPRLLSRGPEYCVGRGGERPGPPA